MTPYQSFLTPPPQLFSISLFPFPLFPTGYKIKFVILSLQMLNVFHSASQTRLDKLCKYLPVFFIDLLLMFSRDDNWSRRTSAASDFCVDLEIEKT